MRDFTASTSLSETILIVRNVQRDKTINIQTSSHKVPVFLLTFECYSYFHDSVYKNTQI